MSSTPLLQKPWVTFRFYISSRLCFTEFPVGGKNGPRRGVDQILCKGNQGLCKESSQMRKLGKTGLKRPQRLFREP